MEKCKRTVEKAYNKFVLVRTFSIRDWVLRKNFDANKLDDSSEGLYQVTEIVGK